MKYIVEVKYTNPAHEHVSLRRRVDTVRRVVEAATETEAINRVTRQQRSLGFLVKESAVVNTGAVEQSLSAGSAANKPKKKIVGDEGETEIKKEPVKEADSKRYMRPVENQLPAGLDKPKKKPEEDKKEPVKEAVGDVKTRNPGYGYHGQHSDAKTADTEYSKAHAMVMQHAKATSSQARDYLDSTHGRHLAGNENPGYIKKDFSGFMKRYTPDTFKNYKESVDEARVMSDPVFRSVSSKILTKNMDPNFGYAPNKLPTHIKTAQAKSDALSKVEKRPQAGTLAAQKANEEVEEVEEARKMSRVEWRMGTQDTVDANNYKIFKKLSATDPVKAQAFHDNLLKMKKKDVKEEVEDKKAGKSRKAAERMINLAKGKKNQINLEPFVDTHKVPMLPTTGK